MADRSASAGTEPIPPKSMLIKTDKPRPFTCTTCTRSFARLEHLKRHERSHTKEKPFQCPVCERSFARRDLLLRHRQKLHAAFPVNKKLEDQGSPRRKRSRSNATPAPVSLGDSTQQAAAAASYDTVGEQSVNVPPSVHAATTAPSAHTPVPQWQQGPSEPFPLLGQPTIPWMDGLQSGLEQGHQSYPNPHQVSDNTKRRQELAAQSTRSSRANSFSAAKPNSYATVKDEAFFNEGWDSIRYPTDVTFATPQNYPEEPSQSPDFLDLRIPPDAFGINPQLLEQDLNFDSPGMQGAPSPWRSSPRPSHVQALPDGRPRTGSRSGLGGSPDELPQENYTDDFLKYVELDAGVPVQEHEPQPDLYKDWTDSGFSGASGTSVGSVGSAGSVAFESPEPPESPTYIRAFYSSFSGHLPFVHTTTEGIKESPLALVQMALGALALGEIDNAMCFYSRAKDLAPHRVDSLVEFQVELLLAILGLFHSEKSEVDAAVMRLEHLARDTKALGLHLLPQFALGNPPGPMSSVEEKWVYFIASQSRVRALYSLHAVGVWLSVMLGRSSIISLETLSGAGSPCEESLWAAPTAEEWYLAVETNNISPVACYQGTTDMGRCMAMLRAGKPLIDRVPQFVLQSLLLLLLGGAASGNYPSSAALCAWETTWSCSPLASFEPTSQFGPLMSDCVPLVSLAASLSAVKWGPINAAVSSGNVQAIISELNRLRQVNPDGILTAGSYAIDTLTWCDKHVKSPTLFFPSLIALVDSGLVLSQVHMLLIDGPSTQTEHELVQRSTKLISRVLHVDDSELGSLASSALQVVEKLLHLAHCPLVGAISEVLQALESDLVTYS